MDDERNTVWVSILLGNGKKVDRAVLLGNPRPGSMDGAGCGAGPGVG